VTRSTDAAEQLLAEIHTRCFLELRVWM